MNNIQDVSVVLSQILSQIMPSYPAEFWQADTALFGAIAEFDSMSIVNLIGEIEDGFDIVIADEDIEAEHFSTVASLAELVLGLVQANTSES